MNTEEFISLLDRKESFYGEIQNTGEEKGEAFAQFDLNPLETNNMRATLTHLSGNYHQAMADDEFSFVQEEGRFRIQAKIENIGSHFGDVKNEITGDVKEFTKSFEYNYEDKTVTLSRFQFFSPLAPILAGRDIFKSKIKIKEFEITLSEESFVQESGKESIGIPLKILYRQGKLEIAVPGSFEQAQATARALTDCIDKALSIFSQDSISWNREVSKKFNGKNIPIGEQELLRWAVAPKGVRTDYGKNAGGLQDSIGILANAITELSGSEKVFFDKIYNCFLNVWLAPHFELYLVLWHACLDAFKHHYGFSGQPFSQNLVKACQAANVTFSDLFPIDFKKLQSGKEKFIFTELRNEYLHNGLIIEDFLVAVEQIKKMKALANRFLMRFLKLDENFCSLGETYTPW